MNSCDMLQRQFEVYFRTHPACMSLHISRCPSKIWFASPRFCYQWIEITLSDVRECESMGYQNVILDAVCESMNFAHAEAAAEYLVRPMWWSGKIWRGFLTPNSSKNTLTVTFLQRWYTGDGSEQECGVIYKPWFILIITAFPFKKSKRCLSYTVTSQQNMKKC